MSKTMTQMRRIVARALLVVVALTGVLLHAAEADAEGMVNAQDDCVNVEAPFTDVPDDHYAAADIDCLQSLGIVWGTTNTTFSPNRSTTRAQTAALLARTWRAAGHLCPTADGAPFTDVPDNHYAAADIDCLHDLGIMNGETDTTFGHSKTVPNARMANLLARMWRTAGHTCPSGDGHTFGDVSASHWASADIDCVYDLGVVPVREDATAFKPSSSIIRADTAVMLARLWKAMANLDADPSDATLRDLALTGDSADIPLTPAFASGTISYKASSAARDIVVGATPNNPKAKIAFNGGADNAPGYRAHNQGLTLGDNTISVKVTAPDGKTTKTYTVVVSFSPFTLTPVADPGTPAPTPTPVNPNPPADTCGGFVSITTENGTIIITDPNSTITSPPDEDPDTPGHQMTFAPGVNVITVVVTAPDGTVTTYKTSVCRASSDSTLESLTVTHGDDKDTVTLSPAFAPDTTAYTATVDHDVTSVEITADPTDPGAETDYVTEIDDLTVGVNTATIEVSPSDGTSSSTTYTIDITRRADATLKAFESTHETEGNAVLTPAFDPGTTAYIASVNNAYDGATVVATPNDPQAAVAITPADVDSEEEGHQLDFAVGANQVTVTVTATDGTTSTYTFAITRDPSSDATLKTLDVTHGTDSTAAPLTPAFASSHHTYTTAISQSVDRATITAVPNHTEATVTITPADADTETEGHQIDLPLAGTTVTITVTAEDGTQAPNTLTIGRLSADATLKTLDVTHGTDSTAAPLTPAFASSHHTYTTAISQSVDRATITAVPNHTEATVTITPADADTETEGHQIDLPLAGTTVTITVTAEDGTQAPNTLTIGRLSADATLKTLDVTHGTDSTAAPLTPAFASSHHTYTTAISQSVDRATITAVPNHTEATVTITPADADTETEGHQIDLPLAGTTVTITVTAEDGTQAPNTLTIGRLSADATLETLDVANSADGTAVTLSPSFESTNTDYTATVDTTVVQATITPVATDANATLTITPADADTKAAGHQTDLTVGQNAVSVTVTAGDGITTKTYSVTVTRNAEPRLSALTVTHGADDTVVPLSPTFAEATFGYTGDVDHAVSQVTVTATPARSGDLVSITPADADTDTAGHQVDLTSGAVNEVRVQVSDGTNPTSSYTSYGVDLTRAAAPGLSALTVTYGAGNTAVALTPAFATGTYSYTAGVDHGVSQVTMAGTSLDPNDTVSYLPADADPKAAGHQVNLSVASNTVTVTVTAEDGTTTKTYTVTITRAADSSLKDLAVDKLQISPTFSASTTSYSVIIPHAATEVGIRAEATDAEATVSINGQTGNSDYLARSIPMPAGTNSATVTVVATATDNTTTTYTVTITRAADSSLKDLAVDKLQISPTFSASTTSYSVIIPHAATEVGIRAEATDAEATVSINGQTGNSDYLARSIPMPAGTNSATVTVVATATDNTTTTYTVTITRGAPSSDATLSGISVSVSGGFGKHKGGTLSPSFDSDTTSYDTRVAPQGQVTVSATATDSNATITYTNQSFTAPMLGYAPTVTILVTAEDGTTTKTYTVSAASDYNISG